MDSRSVSIEFALFMWHLQHEGSLVVLEVAERDRSSIQRLDGSGRLVGQHQVHVDQLLLLHGGCLQEDHPQHILLTRWRSVTALLHCLLGLLEG